MLSCTGAENDIGEGGGGFLTTMLMVKAVVLFYSAKLLNMGVLVVFMHD